MRSTPSPLLVGLVPLLASACEASHDPCGAAVEHRRACGDEHGAAVLASACTPDLAAEALAAPCDPGVAGDDKADEALLTWWGRPEVGRIVRYGSAGCVATLIAPNAVLTAGHCVRETRTIDPPTNDLTFRLTPDEATAPTDYPIAEVHNFDVGTRESDVAIARLSTAVPAALATPATIAEADPWPHETVTYFYNPRSACRRVEPENARLFQERAWWRSPWSCRGDSGGPLMAGTHDGGGGIVRVIQGVYGFAIPTGEGDIFSGPSAIPVELWPAFGDPVRRREEILAIVARWAPAIEPVAPGPAPTDEPIP